MEVSECLLAGALHELLISGDQTGITLLLGGRCLGLVFEGV
jgi:hypothetical protein